MSPAIVLGVPYGNSGTGSRDGREWDEKFCGGIVGMITMEMVIRLFSFLIMRWVSIQLSYSTCGYYFTFDSAWNSCSRKSCSATSLRGIAALTA